MKETVIKNFDELPMFISVATVAKLFGISQSSGYELMHDKDFPSIKIGTVFTIIHAASSLIITACQAKCKSKYDGKKYVQLFHFLYPPYFLCGKSCGVQLPSAAILPPNIGNKLKSP